MNETPRPSLPSSIALAAVLAVGALFVWGVVAIWEFAVQSQLFSQQQPSEQLAFTEDGRSLVQSSTYGSGSVTVFRTLDGQQIDNLDQYKLQDGSSWLPGSGMPFLFLYGVTGWYARLTGFLEPGGVPNYWYFDSDREQLGRGYFIGFDAKTKNMIGYIGTAGLRSDPPPADQRFEIERNTYFGRFAGQSGVHGREPFGYSATLPPSLFLVSSQSLLLVDLRRRLVNKLPIDGTVPSVSDVSQPVRVADEPDTIIKPRIAVRLADRVQVLDQAGNPLRSIAVPPEVRDRVLVVYLTTGAETILVATDDLLHELTEALWLGPQGDVVRHEQLRLRGGFFASMGQPSPWMMAVDFPSPLLCAIQFAFVGPRQSVKIGRFDDFRTALAASLDDSWSPFLAVLAVSAVLAVVCYRRQRRYSRRGAIAWAIFVLLTGPAGLVGYLLHRQWPATERCAACGAATPRDRESCLACSAEFARPAAKGIEIFA